MYRLLSLLIFKFGRVLSELFDMTTATLSETPATEPIQHLKDNPQQEAQQSATNNDWLDREVCEKRKSGLSIRKIAVELGVSQDRVYRSINRQIRSFEKVLAPKGNGSMIATVTREEIMSKIFSNAPKAVEKVVNLMESADKQEVQLKAATDILSRSGFDPVARSVQLSIVEEMSREDLVSAIKSMLMTGDISPVEPITLSPEPVPDTNMGESGA